MKYLIKYFLFKTQYQYSKGYAMLHHDVYPDDN